MQLWWQSMLCTLSFIWPPISSQSFKGTGQPTEVMGLFPPPVAIALTYWSFHSVYLTCPSLVHLQQNTISDEAWTEVVNHIVKDDNYLREELVRILIKFNHLRAAHDWAVKFDMLSRFEIDVTQDRFGILPSIYMLHLRVCSLVLLLIFSWYVSDLKFAFILKKKSFKHFSS